MSINHNYRDAVMTELGHELYEAYLVFKYTSQTKEDYIENMEEVLGEIYSKMETAEVLDGFEGHLDTVTMLLKLIGE